jgi:hypothetical protein
VVLLNKLLKLYYFFIGLYNGNCVFLAVTYDKIFRLCRVYRGSESSCLTYYNFLKYDKTVAEDCLLLYYNHLRRYWDMYLLDPLREIRKSYRIIKLLQLCSLHLKSSNPVWLPQQNDFRNFLHE